MNKIIAAMVGLLMLASPALATYPCYGYGCMPAAPDTASSSLSLNTSGVTTVATLSKINGWDGAFRAGVAENVYNDGIMNMWTSVGFSVPSFGASEMIESKVVASEGDTSIIKQVSWASPGPANTANLFIGWATPSASDEVDVTNVGSGNALYNMATNSLLVYMESFGLNMDTDCDPIPPVPPVLPQCECDDCVC